MRLSGRALRVSIFIDDDDTWHHKPLYHEIVHRAKIAGLASASVFRGFRPQLDELVSEGPVTSDEVEVIRHVGREAPREAAP